MNINKTKQGFTLAETLITLIIIGVISTLTIPTIQATSKEKAYVSALNKAYTELTAATTALETKYGPLQFWDWSDSNKIMKMYGEQFSFVESSGTTGVTLSGMSWTISPAESSAENSNGTSSGGIAIVDVNTDAIKPNQNGVDRFAFRILPDKVAPFGADNIGLDSEYKTTYKVLQTGKIQK